MRSIARVALLLIVLASASSCDATKLIDKTKLEKLVLAQSDLPAGFASFYNGPQVRLDDQGTVRSDPGRFRREGGWISRLRQADPAITHGLQVIESRADLFPDVDGAQSDLDLYRRVLAATSGQGLENVSVPALGDEAIGITFTMAGARPVRFYRIAWRSRNATASLTVQAFEGEVGLADAVGLARTQQNHIDAA
jgi:hypothetical protein